MENYYWERMMKSRAVARFRLFINALDIPEGNRTNERHRYIDVVRRYFGENNRHMFTVLVVNMCPLFCLSFIPSVQYLPALRFAQRHKAAAPLSVIYEYVYYMYIILYHFQRPFPSPLLCYLGCRCNPIFQKKN